MYTGTVRGGLTIILENRWHTYSLASQSNFIPYTYQLIGRQITLGGSLPCNSPKNLNECRKSVVPSWNPWKGWVMLGKNESKPSSISEPHFVRLYQSFQWCAWAGCKYRNPEFACIEVSSMPSLQSIFQFNKLNLRAKLTLYPTRDEPRSI